MSTAAEPLPSVSPLAGGAPARTWMVFTTVLTWAVFLQAVTAGRILTGDQRARDATWRPSSRSIDHRPRPDARARRPPR